MSLPPAWQPDPVTAVYKAIRNGLIAHQGFATLLKITSANATSATSHFPDMSNRRFEEIKQEVQAGDLPEVLLIQSLFKFQTAGPNSMTSLIEQSFDLVMTIDQLQVPPLNAVKWNAFVAMAQWADDLGLSGLVRDWNARDAMDDAFGQKQWKRDTTRYSSVIRISTTLCIPRRLLAGEFQPSGII